MRGPGLVAVLLLAACSRTPAVPAEDVAVPRVVSGPELIAALAPRGEELVLANFWATW